MWPAPRFLEWPDSRRHGNGQAHRHPNPRRRSAVPWLEVLEGRALLSVVTSPLDDGSSGTLRYQITHDTAGATITIAPNVRQITLTQGELKITQDLTISGLGADKPTISGNKASRVFEIGNGATVTLANLIIADGQTFSTGEDDGSRGGGGILNDAGATLNLTRSSLTNNTATARSNTVDVFGGGLLNLGIANVVSSTFTGNQALGGGGGSFFGGSVGGGIDNFDGGTLTVTDSIFVHNQALGTGSGNFGIGGAIENNAGLDLDLAHPSTATITGSVFTGNRAGGGAGVKGNGGALDNEGIGATMTLSNSRIVGNQSGGKDSAAGIGGGLMNFAGSMLTIQDSTLSDNLATGGAGSTQNGGGIDNQSLPGPHPGEFLLTTMTINNSTLIGNRSVGGAGGNGNQNSPDLLGEGLGGGIMNVIHATLTITNSRLTGNQAIGGANGTPTPNQPFTGGALGGGIENIRNSTLTIDNSTLTDNVAKGGSSNVDGAKAIGGQGVGGGINVGFHTPMSPSDNSTLTVTNSTLTGNLALGGSSLFGHGGDGLGGGLAVQAESSATVANSTLTGNLALGGVGLFGTDGLGKGGGVYNLGMFTPDVATIIKKNHASTSNDNIFP